MSIYLHFTSRKIQRKKLANKIIRSPDTNILESTWDYIITKVDKWVNKINKII